jgi:peptide/nickel transport system permease protein
MGAAIGLAGPLTRTILSRVVDMMLAFPTILIALFVGAILGPGERTSIIAVGVGFTPAIARFSAKLISATASHEYVAAARLVGVSPLRLSIRYLLANSAEALIVFMSFALSVSLVAISSISFLGFGVQSPQFDWGSMLADGIRSFYVNPAQALSPAFAIIAAGLSFGLAGETLARGMNPQNWTGDRLRGHAEVGMAVLGGGSLAGDVADSRGEASA